MLRHPVRWLLALSSALVSACTDLAPTPTQPAAPDRTAQPADQEPPRPYHPYKGGFSGNGSIHALLPVRDRLGRWRLRHYRWDVPATSHTVRVGGFRFRTRAEALAALEQARDTICVQDTGGVLVSLDVPLWDRPQAVTDPDEQEIQLAPRPGESLTLQVVE